MRSLVGLPPRLRCCSPLLSRCRSGTHSISPKRFFQPQSEADVEFFVAESQKRKKHIRVFGSGLSPNGLGFSGEGMMSMALLDKIISIDRERMQVCTAKRCIGGTAAFGRPCPMRGYAVAAPTLIIISSLARMAPP